MGFFDNIFNAAARFYSSTLPKLKGYVQSAWDKTKQVAARAVSWMAEKAESFVGKAKDVWHNVRPYIDSHVRPIINGIEKYGVPWIGSAVTAFERLIDSLIYLEDSVLGEKLHKAILWAIEKAKRLNDTILTPSEIDIALDNSKVFDSAESVSTEESVKAIRIASMINDILITQTLIAGQLSSETLPDFHSYLRLRSSQKLLAILQKDLEVITDIDLITDDDFFLVKVSKGLVQDDYSLSEQDAQRWDAIIANRYGQKLIPFVFEEMTAAWQVTLDNLEEEWSGLNKSLAKEIAQKRRFEIIGQLNPLSEEDSGTLDKLKTVVLQHKDISVALDKRICNMRNYVYAAEGFLQTLEKTSEELESEGRKYLEYEGGKVGMLIIECAQHGRSWETLTEEDQSMIIDYANIFKTESESRAQKLLVRVEVGA